MTVQMAHGGKGTGEHDTQRDYYIYDVAGLLEVDTGRVYGLAVRRAIPGGYFVFDIGGTAELRFRRAEIDAFVAAGGHQRLQAAS